MSQQIKLFNVRLNEIHDDNQLEFINGIIDAIYEMDNNYYSVIENSIRLITIKKFKKYDNLYPNTSKYCIFQLIINRNNNPIMLHQNRFFSHETNHNVLLLGQSIDYEIIDDKGCDIICVDVMMSLKKSDLIILQRKYIYTLQQIGKFGDNKLTTLVNFEKSKYFQKNIFIFEDSINKDSNLVIINKIFNDQTITLEEYVQSKNTIDYYLIDVKYLKISNGQSYFSLNDQLIMCDNYKQLKFYTKCIKKMNLPFIPFSVFYGRARGQSIGVHYDDLKISLIPLQSYFGEHNQILNTQRIFDRSSEYEHSKLLNKKTICDQCFSKFNSKLGNKCMGDFRNICYQKIIQDNDDDNDGKNKNRESEDEELDEELTEEEDNNGKKNKECDDQEDYESDDEEDEEDEDDEDDEDDKDAEGNKDEEDCENDKDDEDEDEDESLCLGYRYMDGKICKDRTMCDNCDECDGYIGLKKCQKSVDESIVVRKIFENAYGGSCYDIPSDENTNIVNKYYNLDGKGKMYIPMSKVNYLIQRMDDIQFFDIIKKKVKKYGSNSMSKFEVECEGTEYGSCDEFYSFDLYCINGLINLA